MVLTFAYPLRAGSVAEMRIFSGMAIQGIAAAASDPLAAAHTTNGAILPTVHIGLFGVKTTPNE